MGIFQNSHKTSEREENVLQATALEIRTSQYQDQSTGSQSMEEEPGRSPLTYVDVLKQDIGLETSELQTAMQDRRLWKAIVVRGLHST